MSDPYDAPESRIPFESDRPPLDSPLQDPHVVAATVLFGMYALFSCGFALLIPSIGVLGVVASATSQHASDILPQSIVAMIEGACIGGIGLVFVGATGGMLSGRKWGWALGLAASGLWMANICCVPFGAYCLFALLRKRVRTAFGIGT